MKPTWLVNGSGAGIDPADRGLAYGDGLFETMAVSNGRIRWLDQHLERLADGCRRLGIRAPDERLLRNEIHAHLPAGGRAVAKLIVTRGIGRRGYAPPPGAEPTRVLGITAWPGYARAAYAEGIRIRTCRLRLGENPQLAGLKHLNRLEHVLAAAEWQGPDWDEGLLRSTAGDVIGGTMSNLFVVADAGGLATPELSRCGVAGVMRRLVIEAAPALGLAVEQRSVSLDELRAAQELFVSNALFGIWPVRRLDDQIFAVGEVSRRIMTRLGYPDE